MSEPTTYGGLAHRPDAPAPASRRVMSEPTKCAGLAHHQTARNAILSQTAGCRTMQVAAPHCRSMARASDTCDT